MKFTSYTGKIIDLENFSPEMICLKDIAHHLTKTCRFNGVLNYRDYCSVAQHSLGVMEGVERVQKWYNTNQIKYALLHDASEAYTGDIPPWVKQLVPEFRKLEECLQNVIYMKYVGVLPELKDKLAVMDVDKSIVVNEAMVYNPLSLKLFTKEPLKGVIIEKMSCNAVERAFLQACARLGIKD